MAAQQIPSGNPGLRWGTRGIGNRASPGLSSNAAFRGEKSGEAQTFEAQWACSRPVSATFPGPCPEPGHESGWPASYSRARPRGDRDASPRATAASMSTPPSGPAATAGPSSTSPEPASSASTATASAISAGFDLVDRSGGRLTLVEDRFSNLAEICAAQGAAAVDGVVMDVGVSSMQLDQAERGFSFRLGGPLDMRMGHDGPTAADVIAVASEADLANIIYIFGEERHSRAVARAIVAARKEAPITTTRALADIVSKVVWSKPGEIHPATRTFQALADLRQRGTRRTASGAGGGRTRAEAGRPAGGGVVPFAGRPHRQEFPGRARQGRRRIAASAGSRTRPRRASSF